MGLFQFFFSVFFLDALFFFFQISEIVLGSFTDAPEFPECSRFPTCSKYLFFLGLSKL